MWQSVDPFAQIKKRTEGFRRKRKEIFNDFGWGNNNNNNNGWGNNNNNNNNGWGNNNNNNGWGNNNNNNGWGHQNINNNNGWGNDNGWGNNNNNNDNGWGNNNNNQNQGTGGLWGNALQGVNWILEMQKRHQSVINPFSMGDIKNILEQQIVLIQPSPHKKILEQLKRTGKTFKDDRFPPNQKSLSGQWGHVSQWSQIKWTPISQGLPGAKIFQGKIQPGDIRQGYLGDCYFLAALAALAERPDRIFQLFLLNEVNEQKYYSVKMLYKGKWMTIDMDENVPFLYNKPAFTSAKDNQLWVVLLEKAWAKLYSSYKRIEAGYPQQGLHDLTGAPVRQISLQGGQFNKDKQWDYLLDASRRQYSMVSSSQPGSDTTKSVSGVVKGHAYTFLNAINMNVQGQVVRLVQLRNPWGKGQFTGKWSDGDASWNMVDPAEKQRVGYNPNKDDGIFFMSYDEYCKQFRALTICQIDDNASYIYKSHKDPQNRGCYFKVIIHKTGNYSFHVDKTPQRSYQDSKQNQFNYPIAQIQIGRLGGNSVSGKRGTNSQRRTLYYDIDVQAGQYVVFVKIHYDKYFQTDFDVNLAIYAEFPCEIKLATKQQAVAFSGNPNVQWTGEEDKVSSGEWNDLKAWGMEENNNNQGRNNNQGGNSNGGWGSNDNNNSNGWGSNDNNGWNNTNNNNSNNGWGQGWGQNNNQGNNNSNNGWGNSGNNGW